MWYAEKRDIENGFLGEAFQEETGIELKIRSVNRGGKERQSICQGSSLMTKGKLKTRVDERGKESHVFLL